MRNTAISSMRKENIEGGDGLTEGEMGKEKANGEGKGEEEGEEEPELEHDNGGEEDIEK